MTPQWVLQYRRLSPRDLEFLHNFALQNTYYCNPRRGVDETDPDRRFKMPGYAWTGSTGADIAHAALNAMAAIHGTAANRSIEIEPPDYGLNPIAQPYRDEFGYWPYLPQFDYVQTYATPYPRASYKVRRSYWTGAPQRRRNLPRP